MKVNPEDLRISMRNWVSGVTVVSTKLDSIIHGMTVSALISVSLEPPVMMVSLQKSTRTSDLILESSIFGISLLNEDQKEISDRFASYQTEDYNRFDGVDIYELTTGSPLIRNSIAGFDCEVIRTVDFETHVLFFGKVVDLKIGNEKHPLVYYDQGYNKISRWTQQ